MANKEDDFNDFMREREQAATAYVQGDPAPVDRLANTSLTSTFFGPDGTIVKGKIAVVESFKKGSANFLPESTSQLEILDSGADGNLGFWTDIQHASVSVEGKDKPVPYELRITEIFRREAGQWKLVHRHADPLKS